ncbi:MAG: diaminopimelate decarboxylase, partial [Lachnospiraceae bacterium]|nr:diaminopimelate decarboxylase [Lachnospiraceae bacterium]
MDKRPFVTLEQLQAIDREYPTPYHLYDEAGLRKNVEALLDAFSWNPGFREYFAVKAEPNPFILKIFQEYDCGCDCSSLTELMLADALGFDGEHIMFSSNDTTVEE